MLPYGWVGKVLKVDLSSEKVSEEPTAKYSEKFLGGYGLATAIFWDEVSPSVKPFDPENLLIFATGPLCGTPVPGSARVVVAGRSPSTYPRFSYTRSNIGGEWGPNLKYSGYDAIVVKGKASEPVYLWINDGNVEFRRATKLWGLDAYTVQDKIKAEVGQNEASVAAIGKAGENMVSFACIIHRRGHAAGQGGFGAIMGSKNLKAIAVYGRRGVKVADTTKLLELIRYVKENSMLACSTIQDAVEAHKTGENWNLAAFAAPFLRPFLKKYALDSKGNLRNTGCKPCSMPCHAWAEVPPLEGSEVSCIQWWYALLVTNASHLVMNEEEEKTFWEVKLLCDKLGLNCYEFMQLIPWLLHMYNEGLITDEKAGVPISKWPKREFIVSLLEKIANREGFGDLLAEGSWRAAEKTDTLQHLLNRDLNKYLGTYDVATGGAGGHGFAGHYDPRVFSVIALLWAMETRDPFDYMHDFTNLVMWSGLSYEQQRLVAGRVYGVEGAVHPLGKPSYSEEEARAVVLIQDRSKSKESLILCDWLYPMIINPFTEDHVGDITVEAKLLSTVTGREYSERDLLLIGERITNLERAIAVLEGRRRTDDDLPELYFNYQQPTLKAPPLERKKWEELKTHYYRLRGWNVETGIPLEETMVRLGLQDVAQKLAKA